MTPTTPNYAIVFLQGLQNNELHELHELPHSRSIASVLGSRLPAEERTASMFLLR